MCDVDRSGEAVGHDMLSCYLGEGGGGDGQEQGRTADDVGVVSPFVPPEDFGGWSKVTGHGV
jgi:hypothetical protein